MKALGLVVSEKKIFFFVFPIVSIWELSVAMEMTSLIQNASKPIMQSISLPSDGSHKI